MFKERVAFHLDPATKEKLEAVARAEHLSTSALMRQHVEKWLAEIPDPEPSGDKVPA